MKVSATRRALLVGAALATMLSASAYAADKPTMGVVVKIGGIPWFNAMETGIKEAGAKGGVDATMIGPTSADPALQVRAIEDLIAKKVNVIGVVPNDEKALEPVLQKAREAGIKVVAHEGPGIQNKDWDFELASAKGFGEAHAELLAKTMGGKGEYAVYVGSLTVPLHNAWADAAIAYLKVHYPDMKQVGDRYGVAENVDDSRKTALDLLAAHPNLHGFLAFGSQGPIGAGRAIEEKGQVGKVFVVGPFSPGQGRKLIKEGAILGGFMWNPAEAGRVFVRVGKMLAGGQEVKDGDTIEGLGVVHPDPKTHNIITDNLLPINKDTVDKLADLGL
ncbi:autoinducer 2 ABC transporter substrate-binding protein [Bradyrhizobium sp. CCGUVB23]|uniref:autoinducer 2 ABC transporter substrate-binding protein n=1 Tax=Bradyrhizobium sp. CCGUVB23 TaxID=2949630 RepID=UPI0020B3ACE6|nr:autoinducer 2 ABC transporter substrate-binding protein [Bradyrhizobium sp. CCGUVB23]MCP3462924.1 autoinducer 2 ABC transporter substrate-binding protein [Bradyrhizobium sp. CCGUVB23]